MEKEAICLIQRKHHQYRLPQGRKFHRIAAQNECFPINGQIPYSPHCGLCGQVYQVQAHYKCREQLKKNFCLLNYIILQAFLFYNLFYCLWVYSKYLTPKDFAAMLTNGSPAAEGRCRSGKALALNWQRFRTFTRIMV